ncbi:MAG: sulfatase-like hydrolase/transferase [Chitinivibrionales bacterium]|nr:sulfatase-like hydrolase/transferase [Chitinivibrionales bacterium]MBD3355963.1 sulfatase-like hydrolase/transferase [Chitinivibrionales bacterium]
MNKRPNILFLFTDQQRFDTLGVLNSKIKTPNLDTLAAEGMLFTRAYPTTPVCLPCRASLVSGQYPSTHGATHNHASLPEDYPNLLPSILRNVGYYTHMVGKSHLASCHDPCSPESAPFIHNREYYRHWHGPWYGFERADIAIGHTTEKHACGMHYGAWLEDHGIDVDKYFGHTAYDAFGTWDLPEEYHSTKWIADVTIDSITRSAEREQPFYICSNFQDPHNPCMVPEPWASMYKPEEIPAFGFKGGEPASFASKPPFYREIIEQPGEYAARPSDPGLLAAGNVSHLPYSKEDTQKNAACYYGMVSLIDHHVGRIMEALESAGQADNTVVVFTSDHPDCLGDHGFWYKSLVTFEEIQRVPMIVRYPGYVPAGTTSAAFQNHVDLPTTLLSLTGATIPTSYEGVDQSPAWRKPEVSVRTDSIIEERPYNTEWNQRVLINDTHKLAFYAGREYGELYDTKNDPDQVHNLWDDPVHAETKNKMIARILSHEMNKGLPRRSNSDECKSRIR